MSRELKGENNPIHRAADKIGAAASTNATTNPSTLSSAGAIGRQFNRLSHLSPPICLSLANLFFSADGNIGQIPQKIGGPFSRDGIIGSQFDASKDGIAGTVERAVDGPSQQATAQHRQPPRVKSNPEMRASQGRKPEGS